MLKKLFMVVVLSLSVSCFAESGGNQSKSLIDTSQQTQSSSDKKQQSQSSQSDSSVKKGDSSQSTEGSNSGKKPSIVEFCQNNPC